MTGSVRTCLVADDHALMRNALADLLRMLWADAEVQTAHDFMRAGAIAAELQPDLILCDLGMPGAGPIAGIAELRRLAPDSRLLVVTAMNDDDLMLPLFDLGVAGFVSKAASAEVLEAAIRLVVAGGHYLPPQLLGLLRGRGDPCSSVRPDPGRLSGRQIDVLRHMSLGHPNKEIARMLDLSPATVKTHVAAILSALHAANRTEAVVRAHDLGLV